MNDELGVSTDLWILEIPRRQCPVLDVQPRVASLVEGRIETADGLSLSILLAIVAGLASPVRQREGAALDKVYTVLRSTRDGDFDEFLRRILGAASRL